jgi:Putative zinc-finger
MSADHLSGKVGCVDVEESLGELALGVLPGDERAVVLEHLKNCKRCQAEAEKLTLTADTLLQLAPEVEPPVGFEVRLFRQLGIPEANPEVNVARRRIGLTLGRLSDRGRVLVASAAVALGVALGFGGGWVANPGPSVASASPYGAAARTATLMSDNHAVGTVSTFAGTPGWMLMTYHGRNVNGLVTCEITLSSGKRVTVGKFRLDRGYGAWAAMLPVSPYDVRSALVAYNGVIAGSATFTT